MFDLSRTLDETRYVVLVLDHSHSVKLTLLEFHCTGNYYKLAPLNDVSQVNPTKSGSVVK